MLCAERMLRKGHTHRPSREVAVPGDTGIRCQVLGQVHHSCPHSPKEPRAASQQNARLRKSQNTNVPTDFSADNLGRCHREHPPCNVSVAFFPLLLPFCAPGSATGHFWTQCCSAVHHRYSKLLEPELEIRFSTVLSQLYCPPYSPPPPHPHLPPVKRCHIQQGLTVRRRAKTSLKFLTSSGFTQSPLETAAWGRFLWSPCSRCRHLVAESLAVALVCALATPGPVLTWNNQSLPLLLPRALLLLGGEAQLLSCSLPSGMCHSMGSHTHTLPCCDCPLSTGRQI